MAMPGYSAALDLLLTVFGYITETGDGIVYVCACQWFELHASPRTMPGESSAGSPHTPHTHTHTARSMRFRPMFAQLNAVYPLWKAACSIQTYAYNCTVTSNRRVSRAPTTQCHVMPFHADFNPKTRRDGLHNNIIPGEYLGWGKGGGPGVGVVSI